jgi:hypothetical protein
MAPDARFVLTPSAVADRYEGLEWERSPSPVPVTWDEADAAATAAGWRLPSIVELVRFLGSLPEEVDWSPAPGAIFWSASGSPFARASRVRVVCFEQQSRYVVLLLEKSERAQRWAVRPAATRDERAIE